jgi:hypothetical protein
MKIDWEKFFTMVIYGLPGSGKTSLLRYLIYSGAQKKQFDHMLLFSGTKGTDDYDFLDDKFKYDSYDNNAIEKYIEICEKANEKGITTRGCLVFDDICGEQSFRSALFKRLFSNYRHYGISIIVIQQMPVELPLSLRSIIKYGIVYKYINEADREKIYNSFGSLIPSKKEFYAIYEKYTNEKYKALFYSSTDVYDNQSPYSGIRAPRVKPFKLKF